MSGGKIFVETLKRVAYPKSNQLNGENFDWWFDIGEEKEFVEWFCNSINEQNVLTAEELTDFQNIPPKYRLDQKDLDKVLATCPRDAESKYDNLPEMTIEKLEEEVKTLQLVRNLKIQRRNKQQLMVSGIRHMPMRLRDEEEECTKLLRETQEQLAAENAKLNVTLSQVIEEVQQLSAIYSSTGSERRPVQQTIFLSQLLLDSYLQQEEQCTAALTEYTKKQLFKGITELVESSDIKKFQLVDITSQSIQGECNEVRNEYRQQMARIQAAYNSGQQQLILAKAKEQSTKARLQYMEQINSSMRNRKLMDLNGAKAKKNSLTKELIPVNVQVEYLINKELPDLIVENAQLLNMPVVKGNFDLQMARQDYYTSKQDQVASQLLKQKTRFELLHLAYEMELCKHRDVHRQLENLTAELEQSRGAFLQRSEMLVDKSLQPSSKQRNVVDSSDTSTIRLCQIFDVDDKQQLFRTYSGLEEQARNLQQDVISLKDQLGTTRREHSYLWSALESDIERLRNVMYSESKKLLLHSEELSEPLQRLECQLQRLPQIIGNIADDIKSKRQILASNLNLQGERVLYVYFFQDPDKLKKIVENLGKKVRVQNIGSES
ncbi:HAUS augmin-like complex subunit 3 [Carcharodon carcharias]|uniref:HAUS augmin-like complex subunit 3 n=1 Tax=Carcharodon carcharias TaxID=13397 RepID=UPI001B7F5A28|nr:HAUS augmin-like complex subunit 3 [Carcharodon carcharias]XP_041041738.1 HAUS augmin-like complex subunit 3 [Carcharodon carcharias]XP_041041739.1 HAUS augmin-like complex subunit 3 [Carcharodon carcharias]